MLLPSRLRKGSIQDDKSLHLNDSEETSPLTLNGYDILKPLGEGSYGKVRVVRQKDNGRYYALKYVDKRHSEYSKLFIMYLFLTVGFL